MPKNYTNKEHLSFKFSDNFRDIFQTDYFVTGIDLFTLKKI